jgi:hypothetical protein
MTAAQIITLITLLEQLPAIIGQGLNDLSRSGELTAAQLADLSARAQAAFAGPAWQTDVAAPPSPPAPTSKT